MNLIFDSHEYRYDIEALCRMFLPGREFGILESNEIPKNEDYIYTGIIGEKLIAKVCLGGKELSAEGIKSDSWSSGLDVILFGLLRELTGKTPKWGVLTGIRPIKIAMGMKDSGMTVEEIRKKLTEKKLVSEEKANLAIDTMEHEVKIRATSKPESVSLYISIPFCPSRCSYCSFTSHSIEKAAKLIPQYVPLLCEELRSTAVLIDELGLTLETVYMGGGTPTVLTSEQLDTVLSTVNEAFHTENIREFTVEAGRPDTITPEKLAVMRKNGIDRISINPQTMNDEVLEKIGRKHTAQDIVNAYRLARTYGFKSINMDLISGLPGDTMESFKNTVEQVLALEPDNITLHTLTVKHGANLATEAENVFMTTADDMNEYAYPKFYEAGYFPYYLYRQKGTIDNLENVGFCKEGKEGIYNIFIMDETHTILSTGAGGVTKLKEPNGKKIERIFNFKYPYEYIDRYSMIGERKEQVKDFYERFPLFEKAGDK